MILCKIYTLHYRIQLLTTTVHVRLVSTGNGVTRKEVAIKVD